MKWYHAECCGEDEKYDGAFACLNCRSMSSQLTDITSVLQEITSQLAVEGSTSNQVSHSPQTVTDAPKIVHPQPQPNPSHVYATVKSPCTTHLTSYMAPLKQTRTALQLVMKLVTRPGLPATRKLRLRLKPPRTKRKERPKNLKLTLVVSQLV
jgi:hypothetical protein